MKLAQIVPAKEEPAPAPEHAGSVVDFFIKKPLTGAVEGLSAGIGQAREESSAEKEKAKIARALMDLQVAQELQDKLRPRFEARGFRLARAEASHPFGKRMYAYTAVRNGGVELALAQVPPEAFATDKAGDELYLSDFTHMLKAFREKKTRLLSQGIQGITYGFKTAIKDERRGADWQFIAWNDVVALRDARLEFWQAFAIEEPSSVSTRPDAQPKAIGDAERKVIVEVLTRLATADYPDSETAFRALVNESPWPQEWKKVRLSGWKNSAPVDAWTIVEYMKVKSTFPPKHELEGRSVLGEFLLMILPKVGGEDAKEIARIVDECGLAPDTSTFTKDDKK